VGAGHFFGPDKDAMEKAFPDVLDAIIRFTVDGPERAINVANTKKK